MTSVIGLYPRTEPPLHCNVSGAPVRLCIWIAAASFASSAASDSRPEESSWICASAPSDFEEDDAVAFLQSRLAVRLNGDRGRHLEAAPVQVGEHRLDEEVDRMSELLAEMTLSTAGLDHSTNDGQAWRRAAAPPAINLVDLTTGSSRGLLKSGRWGLGSRSDAREGAGTGSGWAHFFRRSSKVGQAFRGNGTGAVVDIQPGAFEDIGLSLKAMLAGIGFDDKDIGNKLKSYIGGIVASGVSDATAKMAKEGSEAGLDYLLLNAAARAMADKLADGLTDALSQVALSTVHMYVDPAGSESNRFTAGSESNRTLPMSLTGGRRNNSSYTLTESIEEASHGRNVEVEPSHLGNGSVASKKVGTMNPAARTLSDKNGNLVSYWVAAITKGVSEDIRDAGKILNEVVAEGMPLMTGQMKAWMDIAAPSISKAGLDLVLGNQSASKEDLKTAVQSLTPILKDGVERVAHFGMAKAEDSAPEVRRIVDRTSGTIADVLHDLNDHFKQGFHDSLGTIVKRTTPENEAVSEARKHSPSHALYVAFLVTIMFVLVGVVAYSSVQFGREDEEVQDKA
eukprot:gnl/TRDRNA2_/TRDRNA2_67321_c0_seq1.p1 gnl/TRDRNA2_/TRDRNA2_67321_c0~~gnl/TRDRNA2_/TRDRNA2_67321_c0_seq1.p1  ORF type:complete len:567 (-),score=85.74 gnl/TRDRNA2_/TRDRNA2_67321_c0_seq1:141-1841(-)